MFSSSVPKKITAEGRYFIDRDPLLFQYARPILAFVSDAPQVLTYLRTGCVDFPENDKTLIASIKVSACRSDCLTFSE